MLTSEGWRPCMVGTAVPGPLDDDDLVIPARVDLVNATMRTPVVPVTITPPVRVLGWDGELSQWGVLAQYDYLDRNGVPTAFNVGPSDPPPKYLLHSDSSTRALYLQVAGLSDPVEGLQRGVSKRSDT